MNIPKAICTACTTSRNRRSHPYLGAVASRYFSVYVAGDAWTGALGLGRDVMIDPNTSDVCEDDRENKFTELRYHPYRNKVDEKSSHLSSLPLHVHSAAAGWGHTALVLSEVANEQPMLRQTHVTKLLVAGRPYDFQTLLRLKRLPSFFRRMLISATITSDDVMDTSQPSNRHDDSTIDSILNTMTRFLKKLDGSSKDIISLKKHPGIMPNLVEISLPDGDQPAIQTSKSSNHHKLLAASAGITAIIGQSGKLYTFGLNNRGQCGVNQPDINHVWSPTPIAIRSTDNFISKEGATFVSVALGLQHGIAMDDTGSIYSWGKGSRGQLGVWNATPGNHDLTESSKTSQNERDSSIYAEFAALQVTDFQISNSSGKEMKLPSSESKALRISAGFNHSAAITTSNHAWVWGKNTKYSDTSKTSSIDSPVPSRIEGLPLHLSILDVACGSHHTSILMEDGSVYAIGVATDNLKCIVDCAVQIVPSGVVNLPIHQFTSHFDRTTIVYGDGKVLEAHLWSSEEMRDEGVFEPAWVQSLTSRPHGNDNERIKMVHRGWRHTVVIASSSSSSSSSITSTTFAQE